MRPPACPDVDRYKGKPGHPHKPRHAKTAIPATKDYETGLGTSTIAGNSGEPQSEDWQLYVMRTTFHGDDDSDGTLKEGVLTLPSALTEFKKFAKSHDHLRLEYAHLECGDAFTLMDFSKVDKEANDQNVNLYDLLCYGKLRKAEETVIREVELSISFFDM
tara:strand:- start:64 stop:546 length:483 start_codon:yes stop_codon:yes gene_type:complete